MAIIVWRRTPALEVLLLHRSLFDCDFAGDWAWTSPGGRRNPHESAAGAAERELLEETGLRADCTLVEPGLARRRVGLDIEVFAAEAPVDADVVLSAEHDRYEWVGVSGLTRCRPAWVPALYVDVLRSLDLV